MRVYSRREDGSLSVYAADTDDVESARKSVADFFKEEIGGRVVLASVPCGIVQQEIKGDGPIAA